MERTLKSNRELFDFKYPEDERLDYSKYMKPKKNAKIQIGSSFQAIVGEIDEEKNKKELKEFQKFADELNKDKKVYLKNQNEKIQNSKNINKDNDNLIPIKKRRIEKDEA